MIQIRKDKWSKISKNFNLLYQLYLNHNNHNLRRLEIENKCINLKILPQTIQY